MATLKYAGFELKPCVYIDREAWVLFNPTDGWKQVPLGELTMTAATKTKAQFDALFPHLPPIPSAAFHSGE